MQADPLECTMENCRNPRADQDPRATNRHCRTHRNEAQKRYVMSKLEQQSGKGIARGITMMRELLVEEFDRQGSAQFTGYEIAELIRCAPGPAIPRETPEAVAS